MFLFRFIKFLKFRRYGITPEWEERYNYLCECTDYLYLREKELRSSKKTMVGYLLYCIAMWWLSLFTFFSSFGMILLSIVFTLTLSLYALSVFSYIPMEIEQTRIVTRQEVTRRPSSVVRKKIREHGVEILHKYFIYTTSLNKKAVDMTDRILGYDQGYQPEELVLCFTGINNDYYYVLPKLEENENYIKENTNNEDI